MNDVAIKVGGLTKIYRLYNDPVDRLKESLHPLRKKYHRDFYALNDVSFEIKKGETVGIIGKNGCGKSTLLQMVAGVLSPTAGDVTVVGKVSALLELGAGFNPDLNGIENIYFSGLLMGFSREVIDEKLDDILSFADIGEFVHQPVKIYSSGMFVRLAFGLAINVDPDILIIDEALSVGDVRFQQKCMAKIRDMFSNKTVIFVSHDTHAITELCNRAIWLDRGNLRLDGPPKFVSEKYLEHMYSLGREELSALVPHSELTFLDIISRFDEISHECRQFGDRRAEIVGTKVFTTHGASSIVYSGEWVEIKLLIKVNQFLKKPIFGFILKDRLGRDIFGDNSYLMGVSLNPLMPEKYQRLTFRLESWPNLYQGEYSLSLAVADGDFEEHHQCHWIHDGLVLNSVPARIPGGMFSELQTSVFYEEICSECT